VDSLAGIVALDLGLTGNSALLAALLLPDQVRAYGLGGCPGLV
jgi:hypothetical protein